jgi:hypothetical protein
MAKTLSLRPAVLAPSYPAKTSKVRLPHYAFSIYKMPYVKFADIKKPNGKNNSCFT